MHYKAISLLQVTLLFILFAALHSKATTYYVNVNGTNATPPYTNWCTAATNIQNAVDTANSGDLVLVTNGTYTMGGRVVGTSTTTNCVVVTNAITVQSINGPAMTVIQAYPAPDSTNGATRCVYLGSGSTLSGFTLENGSVNGDSGGGIYCQSSNSIVSNCVITVNSAGDGGGGYYGAYNNCIINSNRSSSDGGGIYLGSDSMIDNYMIFSNSCKYSGGGIYCQSSGSTALNCAMTGNSAEDGGGIYCAYSYNCLLSNCVITFNSAEYGGGGYSGTYNDCIISSNTASSPQMGEGGGLYLLYDSLQELNNCVIAGNSAGSGGGIVFESNGSSFPLVLNNCTIIGNSASQGGGVYNTDGQLFLTNCIVYYNNVFNYSPNGTNIEGTTNVFYCCTTPTNGFGVNNITASPGFVNIDAGNFSLAAWSPCIDAGTNAAVTSSTDLAGNPRIVNGTVDIGAYEYQYQFTNLVHYVVLKNTNAAPPFTNWLTAATNIQNAIDASSPGDFIVVSNGIYNTPGRAVYGVATNIISVDLPVTVQGLSGAGNTFIQGNHPNGPGIRCAYLTNGAVLIGLTLTNGWADSEDFLTNESGGGVWCEGPSATLINCSLERNYANNCGGGSYSGTMIDCIYSNNDAYQNGGGSYSGTLFNCIVEHNTATYDGGGASSGISSNCLFFGNFTDVPYRGEGGGACSNIFYSCLLISNLCYVGGGASASVLNNCTLIGNVATNSGGGAYSSTLTNCTLSANGAVTNGGGAYSCALSNCTLTGNWATNGGGAMYGVLVNCILTTNIAIVNGGGAVSNTLYNCYLTNNVATNNGGGTFYSSLTNCVLYNNLAIGNGGGAFGGTLNNSLMMSNTANAFGGGSCFAVLSNCIITNNLASNGGGSCSNTIYNCVLSGNFASGSGGGAYGGILNNSLIITNVTYGSGGGSCFSAAYSCSIIDNQAFSGGGGCYGGTITSCLISNNIAPPPSPRQAAYGGGAAYSILTDCLIVSNQTGAFAGQGGGAYHCYLNNCTIAYNVGEYGGIFGGGATNCIIYYNIGLAPNYYVASTFDNCCTYPLPTGSGDFGNFTNAPLFVSTNNFHLQSNSPCINSGNNAYVSTATDLDGNPRIVGGTVDIGAYEYQTPTSVISYTWLQQYFLPTDGSVDYADLDGTAFNIYQDWIAGLNPTNPASVLAMLPPPATNNASGITVSWQSVSGIVYNLLRSTNLTAQPFSSIQTITGQAVTTSYTDTSATNNVPYFYQVAVP